MVHWSPFVMSFKKKYPWIQLAGHAGTEHGEGQSWGKALHYLRLMGFVGQNSFCLLREGHRFQLPRLYPRRVTYLMLRRVT